MERPILFSDEMVRAILAGRKMQTRRVLKPQPVLCGPQWQWGEYRWFTDKKRPRDVYEGGTLKPCPCGNVGDRLWVKEAFAFGVFNIIYAADWSKWGNDKYHRFPHPDAQWLSDMQRVAGVHVCPGEFKSSRFMPRKASRITLEITGIRVERVQDISEDDARAEGFGRDYLTPRDEFAMMWDILNKSRGFGWDANPWVFAINFKVIQPAA